MKRYAKNKTQAAKILGISRSGFQRFFELEKHPEARADGRIDLHAWSKFISAAATRLETGTPTIPLSLKDQRRIRLLELQIQREEVKLRKENDDLIRGAKSYFKGQLEGLWTRLERLLRFELPPVLEQRPARQISDTCRDRLTHTWNEWCVQFGGTGN